MAKTERGGIRLVVENYEQFNRQLQAASKTMSGFGQSAQQTAQAVNASASEYRGSSVVIEQWSETVDDSADRAAVAAQSMTTLGLAMAAAGTAAIALMTQTGLTASRIEELAALLDVTRQNAAYHAMAQGDMSKAMDLSSDAVQKQVQGIRDLHLSGEVANQTVAALIRYNLDWTKATELARLAQDAATFAMQDSSEAVQGLIHGITTLQPRVLRSYGIMVNLNEAYRVYAKENNLVATQLTQAQRQQAAFNAVLAQAPSIAGAYEAAMSTASKQVRSLKTDIVNLSEAFGEEFTPLLTSAVGSVRDILHWLTELSDPMQSFIVYAGGSASALTAFTGTALTLIPRLPALATGFRTLASAIGLTSVALGGILTIVPLAIGALAALKNAEDARKEEAISILASSENYDKYVEAMSRAELGNYTLAESVYDTAQAHLDAADAALKQVEAEKLVVQIDALKRVIKAYYNSEKGLERHAEVVRENRKEITDLMLELYANEDAMVAMAIQMGFNEEAAREWAQSLGEIAALEVNTRDALDRLQSGDFEEWAEEAKEKTEEFADSLLTVEDGGWRASKALNQYWQHLKDVAEESRNLVKFQLAGAEAFDKTSKQLADAMLRRNRALEDMETKYFNQAQDAWIKHRREILDIEGDLAAFHAGTLSELLDIDREYLQDRNDAWTQYQQDLEDAERELQRDIEDANRDRAQKLADLEREYAQDRADALRELNEDLQDAAEDHAQRLVDIERERQESLLDLEQEYQDKLYDIQNLAAQRLRDLQDEYAEKESDARLKYLRQALEYLRDEGIRVSEAYEDILRRAFIGGEDALLPFIVQSDVRDMYAQLVEELARLNDDQRWEEEDLSDDIDREQERRLEDLEEWLAEEQAAIEESYAERLAAEEKRFAEEQEARRRDYEQKLVDLERAYAREQEEINRNHQRRIDDIRLQAERERAEIAEQYARRLEDLEIEYNRERALIGQKLAERRRELNQAYADELQDIHLAKQRERTAINKEYERTKTDIIAAYRDIVFDAAEEFGQLPDNFQPVYDELETQARNEMHAVRTAIMDEINGLFTDLEARSPSRVMMRLADSILGGLEAGGLNPDAVSDMIGSAFSAQAFQANIQAALPSNMATVPMTGGGGSVTNSQTSNLTVNAQYQHQSEASLRDDLSLWSSMMGVWG